MSKATVYTCDNLYDSLRNPGGEVHGAYGRTGLKKTSEDPQKDGWYQTHADGETVHIAKHGRYGDDQENIGNCCSLACALAVVERHFTSTVKEETTA